MHPDTFGHAICWAFRVLDVRKIDLDEKIKSFTPEIRWLEGDSPHKPIIWGESHDFASGPRRTPPAGPTGAAPSRRGDPRSPSPGLPRGGQGVAATSFWDPYVAKRGSFWLSLRKEQGETGKNTRGKKKHKEQPRGRKVIKAMLWVWRFDGPQRFGGYI